MKNKPEPEKIPVWTVTCVCGAKYNAYLFEELEIKCTSCGRIVDLTSYLKHR